MAIVTTVEKLQGRLLLNNGTDQSGNIKTVTVNLPSLLPTATDEQILAIAVALGPCLSKTTHSIQRVTTAELDEE